LTFFKKEQLPPWPKECTLCPAGQHQTSTGKSGCDACAIGKLSSLDRASCKDCQAGEYNRANLECKKCEAGR